MAVQSIKKIKSRIKSVQSTRRITSAMKLVSASKSKRATEGMERPVAYCKTLKKVVEGIASETKNNDVPYFKEGSGKKCYIIVGGDRGLAGGYNINIFKTAKREILDADIIPIGKKAVEHFCDNEVLKYSSVEHFSTDDARELSKLVMDKFLKHEYSEVNILYMRFINMLKQEPVIERLLPVICEAEQMKNVLTVYEPSAEAVLDMVVPKYTAGMLFKCIKEAFASETIARRVAMEAATTNADDMIENLKLDYNRARQGAVTRELTEIVSGAGIV